MFTDLDKYIHLLCELEISANQFLLCYLHYTDEREDGELIRKGSSMSNLYRYAENAEPWDKKEVRDLVDKGYLEDPHYDKDRTYPDYLKVTDKFVEKIIAKKDNFKELWDLYPDTMPNFEPGQGDIKLKLVSDYEELRKIYLKKVRSKTKHKKILGLLKWAVENDEINFAFEKFVKGEAWRTLEKVKNSNAADDNMTVQ